MTAKRRVQIYGAMILAAILFIFICMPGTSFFSINKIFPTVENGCLDMTKQDFSENQKIYLGGEWEFYPNKFLISRGDIPNENPLMISVPGYWDKSDYRIDKDSGGYGSFRTTISGLDTEQSISLLLLNHHGAYRAYLDGMLISSQGTLSKDLEKVNFQGELSLFYHRLPSAKEHELIIEYASNSLSGIDTTPVMMKYQDAKTYVVQIATVDVMLSTLLIISFVILLCYYSIMGRKYLQTPLLLLVFSISIRYFFANSHSLLNSYYFPDFGANYCNSIILLLTFIVNFMNTLFFCTEMKLNIRNRTVFKFILFYIGLFILYLIVPPSIYAAYFNKYMLLLGYCLNIYVLYKMYQYVRNGKPFWYLYCSVYIFISTTLIMETYYYNGFIHTGLNTFAPLCVSALIFLFIFITAKRITKSYIMEVDMMKMQEDLNRNQISLMMSQIRPHFLYNALTAIQCLCRTDPPKAEEALLKFAKYLRANLSSINSKEYILFSEELHHIDNYLQIEKLRFGDKLDIIYDVEDTNFMVPLLSIQPIVENAVKHGISKKPEGGHIIISCQTFPDYYEIIVSDDGIGFDTSKTINKNSYGIQNIRQRIQTMNDSTIEIHSIPGEGTEVIVHIKNPKS